MIKTYHFKLKNQKNEIQCLLDGCERIFTKNNIPTDRCHDILICLDEAFSNIIYHAYKNETDAIIEIKLKIFSNKKITIIFRDFSKTSSKIKCKGPGIHLDNKDSLGLGVYIMQKLMNKIAYKRLWHNNFLLLSKKF